MPRDPELITLPVTNNIKQHRELATIAVFLVWMKQSGEDAPLDTYDIQNTLVSYARYMDRAKVGIDTTIQIGGF